MHPAQSEPSLGSPWLELARGQGQGSLERQSKGREEEQELTEGIQRCENLLTLESLDIRGFELTVFSMKSFLIGKVATPFLQSL